MSQKRRQRERLAALDERAQKLRLDSLARGIVVDREALARYTSYSTPDFIERGTYIDQPYVCDRCGNPEVWTAEQQKWWYEVAKGIPLSKATRCQPCRRRERERNEPGGPKTGHSNPHLSPKLLLADLQSDIEPKLGAAGFRWIGGIRRGGRYLYYLDCTRADDIFTLSWYRSEGRLIAELLTKNGADAQVIGAVKIRHPWYSEPGEFETRLAEFLATIREFLDGLRGVRVENPDRAAT